MAACRGILPSFNLRSMESITIIESSTNFPIAIIIPTKVEELRDIEKGIKGSMERARVVGMEIITIAVARKSSKNSRITNPANATLINNSPVVLSLINSTRKELS